MSNETEDLAAAYQLVAFFGAMGPEESEDCIAHIAQAIQSARAQGVREGMEAAAQVVDGYVSSGLAPSILAKSLRSRAAQSQKE